VPLKSSIKNLKLRRIVSGVMVVAAAIAAVSLVRATQSPAGLPAPAALAATCQNKSSNDLLECWNSLLGRASLQYGLTATFNLVDFLYRNDPLFAGSCHSYAHLIGQKSYELWAQGKSLDATPSVSSCGYGFYHGFMEALVGRGGQISQARDFCLKIDQQLSKFGSKDASSCFHGIGHGTATPHDTSLYGKPQAMIGPALSLCQTAATEAKQREDCHTGVYSAIATFMGDREYGLDVDTSDPLGLCPKQDPQYQAPCYIGMVVALSSLTQNSLPLAAPYIEKIQDDSIAKLVIRAMTGPVIYSDPKRQDFTEQILDCRRLQPRLRESCLLGFAAGIYEFHSAKDGLGAVFNFCSTQAMTEREHESCFGQMVRTVKDAHQPDEIRSACRQLPTEDQKYCEAAT